MKMDLLIQDPLLDALDGKLYKPIIRLVWEYHKDFPLMIIYDKWPWSGPQNIDIAIIVSSLNFLRIQQAAFRYS